MNASTQHRPSVTIVVPTRKRAADLERCLNALSRLTPPADEIIVVDSAPTTEEAIEVAARCGARYIREPRIGASRARNRGARQASSDIIAYIDDDAVPDPGWLSPVLNEFADPAVALVVGKVSPPSADSAVAGLYELAGFSGQASRRMVVDRATPGWFEKVNFHPFGIAPNMAIRRAALDRWAGFDERLGPGTPVPGHEEQHAFLQLIELGWRLVYTPEALVTHPVPSRSADELRDRCFRRVQASAAYMTLLLVERPEYRRKVLRYVFSRLQRSAPASSPDGDAVSVSRLRLHLSRLKGPWFYLKSRLQHRHAI